MSLDFWTVAIGIVTNVACALLGCFLVLRRLSLLGDAISHGVLPGIALAFLLGGQLTGPWLLVGAMVFGVLTAFLTQALSEFGNVPEDAGMGVVFTSLFAVGIILISRYASNVDLDPGCIFFGNMALVPLDTEVWLGLEVPRAFPGMLLSLLLSLAFITVLWKELKISSFDPGLATAMGLSAVAMHYLLMALVAGVTVTSFLAVGSISVIAMLIVPAATAQLLTDRLRNLVLLAAGLATSAAVLGYFASEIWNIPQVPGMMAVVAGVQFLLAVLFAPRHGLLARVLRTLRLSLRIAAEDLLAGLYRHEEGAPREAIPAGWANRLAGWLLRQRGEILLAADGHMLLSPTGRERARSLIRAHRLWESYLTQNFDLPLDHLHDPAMRMEHYIGPGLQKQLAEELAEPARDPHGKEIPGEANQPQA